MATRWIWWEAAALLLALVLIEMGFLLFELRTSIVRDWFVALAPLIWLNAAVLVLFVFLRQLGAGGERAPVPGGKRRGGSLGLLRPRFDVLQEALRTRRMKLAVVLIAVGYGLLYAFLQGILVLTPAGGGATGLVVLESPIGYGPALAWSPTAQVGLLVRPYTVAAAVALAILSGLILALFLRLVSGNRRALRSLTGPLAGLAVMCPACFASPAAGLLVAYVAPAVTLVGLGVGLTFAVNLGLATALLLVSLLLLWATAAWLSRLLPAPPRDGSSEPGR